MVLRTRLHTYAFICCWFSFKKELAITCKIVFERCRNGGKRNTDTIPYFYLKLKGNAGAPFSTVLIFKFRWKAPSKLCYAKMLTTASNSM